MPDTDNKHTGHSPEFAQLIAANEHSFEMAQLLAAVDDVERLEQQAGLADEHAGARRRLLEPFAAALLGRCRTPGQRAATLKHLMAAVRVRQPFPPITSAEQISARERDFLKWSYRGEEIDELRRILKTNEPITHIWPRTVETDRRTIDRKSLIGERPVYFTNHAWESWLARFPNESELCELDGRVEEERRQGEALRQDLAQSARNYEIAQQQLAASRQRQAEQYEDAIAAIVERSRARRANQGE